MLYEESFGTIALKKEKGIWYTYLIQNKSGNHWGFPKGHANLSETGKSAALRELKEETNLEFLKFLSEKPLIEQYSLMRDSKKTAKKVYYYLIEVTGDAKIQSDEILDGKWVEISKAKDLITYEASKEIANLIEIILQKI
ncbi:MAG: putative mutator protein MutT4 [Candidatus Anoxychlamydiales bacterium]|uniref:Nudix hydrolase domain-containing protein n=1 Tax=marine sediment metagenome TaxID=412755 RepID=A0A0F9HK76_9ZZZZ|nr:putative mutator protein MutT4 [Candidatus Anoxychlamydiales bacterium]